VILDVFQVGPCMPGRRRRILGLGYARMHLKRLNALTISSLCSRRYRAGTAARSLPRFKRCCCFIKPSHHTSRLERREMLTSACSGWDRHRDTRPTFSPAVCA
jgi:hypothetical protein